MNRIKKIFAPTDLSELSQAGVRCALSLARTLGAEVTVYHVVDCNDRRFDVGSPEYERVKNAHRLTLARFLNEHFSDLIPWVKARERVEIGVPDKSIVEFAKREGADLTVISIRAASDLSDGFIGSLAEKIVANLSCPVLCIRGGAEESRQAAVA